MPSFSFILFQVIVSEKKIFFIFFKNLRGEGGGGGVGGGRQPIKLSNFNKSHMKRGGLLKKHICEKHSNISNETAETLNFHFSHYNSMGSISCHSNHSSYPTGIKNTIYVEDKVIKLCMQSISFIHHTVPENVFFNIFSKINPF